jgi:hypothetical protein
MQEVIRLKPIPAVRPAVPRDPGREKALKYIRGLIWAYFVLLIFEGTLRKWILPQFSDVLLVIRDPVVIAIYFLAFRARVFPRNGWVFSLTVIAFLSLAVSFLALWLYLPPSRIVLVSGFGFRCNFLHLPLLFIIGRVLDVEDVKKLGWWILLGMLPMSLLMAAQFNATPDSFVNRGAGLGESLQIGAGGGRIRPAATFSFVSGVICYSALAAAYILYGALRRGVYRNRLLYSAGFALIVAIGVSGSRSTLLAVLLVISSMLVIILVRPNAINQFGRSLLILIVAMVVASQLPFFKEGVQVLSDRFSDAAEAEEKSIAGGLLHRVVGSFTEGLTLLPDAPIGGYGLGIGTNGGAKFLTGQSTFLLTEGEWGRIILESGPILGLAFIIWRTLLTAKFGLISYQLLKRGEILPIILFCAGFISLLNGQFGQPTSLGFAVFVCGLFLATANREITTPEAGSSSSTGRPLQRVARRSPYAERLHTPGVAHRTSDGLTDR